MRLVESMALISIVIVIGIAAAWGESLHARELVERDGYSVQTWRRGLFGCNGLKGRLVYRFTTVDGRSGKICVGAMQHYKITVEP